MDVEIAENFVTIATLNRASSYILGVQRTRRVFMAKAARHVVPNPKGGWSVRQSGSSRATKVFGNQADAVRFARDVAKKEASEVFVHRSDGTIRQYDSYAHESFPPRAK